MENYNSIPGQTDTNYKPLPAPNASPPTISNSTTISTTFDDYQAIPPPSRFFPPQPISTCAYEPLLVLNRFPFNSTSFLHNEIINFSMDKSDEKATIAILIRAMWELSTAKIIDERHGDEPLAVALELVVSLSSSSTRRRWLRYVSSRLPLPAFYVIFSDSRGFGSFGSGNSTGSGTISLKDATVDVVSLLLNACTSTDAEEEPLIAANVINSMLKCAECDATFNSRLRTALDALAPRALRNIFKSVDCVDASTLLSFLSDEMKADLSVNASSKFVVVASYDRALVRFGARLLQPDLSYERPRTTSLNNNFTESDRLAEDEARVAAELRLFVSANGATPVVVAMAPAALPAPSASSSSVSMKILVCGLIANQLLALDLKEQFRVSISLTSPRLLSPPVVVIENVIEHVEGTMRDDDAWWLKDNVSCSICFSTTCTCHPPSHLLGTITGNPVMHELLVHVSYEAAPSSSSSLQFISLLQIENIAMGGLASATLFFDSALPCIVRTDQRGVCQFRRCRDSTPRIGPHLMTLGVTMEKSIRFSYFPSLCKLITVDMANEIEEFCRKSEENAAKASADDDNDDDDAPPSIETRPRQNSLLQLFRKKSSLRRDSQSNLNK